MRCKMIIDDLALHGLAGAAVEADEAPVFHWAHANGYSGRTYQSMLQPISDRMTVYAWTRAGMGIANWPLTQTSIMIGIFTAMI